MSSNLPTPTLPAGFESLYDIDNMDYAKLNKGPLVNVFGVISSHQPPTATKGADWKCTIEIKDNTFPPFDNSIGMKVFFFSARERLPNVDGTGIIKMEKVKVQMREGRVGLITNRATKYYLLPASDLENTATPIEQVITAAYRYQISPQEMTFAMWLYQNLKENSVLPSAQDFRAHSTEAAAVKEKYKRLKDVQADQWCDLVVEIIRIYESGGRMTMYISDYTANSNFFDRKRVDVESESTDRDGDEFGYTSGFVNHAEKDWSGPYGKLSLQLTLFDEHVQSANKVAKVGQWVIIRNVQVKYGKNGQNLEGFLRGGRGGVSLLQTPETKEDADPRYLEALRRRKEYEDKLRKKAGDGGSTSKPGAKRKAESKSNAKKKRRLERKRLAEENAADLEKLNKRLTTALNEYITCSSPDQPVCLLSEWLDPEHYIFKEEGITEPLPFLNRNFRANTRVVDFFPDRLEDFAVGRAVSEYDLLSDHGSGEDSESGYENSRLPQKKEWKWQFALKLEDGDAPEDSKPKGNLWAVVDNRDAQCLLDLDADNLKENSDLLTQLRRRLEILWGDLEERKLAVLKKVDELDSKVPKQPMTSSETGKHKTGENLPLTNRDINIQSAGTQDTQESILEAFQRDPQVKNKAFTCCIREYGVKNKTTGRIEDRIFGMFETRICGD